MKQKLFFLLNISRPKFWLYLAGTYLLGYFIGSATTTDLLQPVFLGSLLFFLIPANIFLYGINDYFDEDTDKYNPRKNKDEHLLKNKERTFLKVSLLFIVIISSAIIFYQKDFIIQCLFVLFFILAYIYSAPPFRLKSKVGLDALSNILYIVPGLIGYYQQTMVLPPLSLSLAFFCWAMAMQLFSSIPDIYADKKAGLMTTAVQFGKRNSLILCIILWGYFSWMIFTLSPLFPLNIIVIIYPLMPFYLLLNKNVDIASVYKWYPYINSIVGFLFFLFFYFQKPYA